MSKMRLTPEAGDAISEPRDSYGNQLFDTLYPFKGQQITVLLRERDKDGKALSVTGTLTHVNTAIVEVSEQVTTGVFAPNGEPRVWTFLMQPGDTVTTERRTHIIPLDSVARFSITEPLPDEVLVEREKGGE